MAELVFFCTHSCLPGWFNGLCFYVFRSLPVVQYIQYVVPSWSSLQCCCVSHAILQPQVPVVKLRKSESDVHDASGMSGGERSYTTLALLMSLTNSIDSPFTCMDEFDVWVFVAFTNTFAWCTVRIGTDWVVFSSNIFFICLGSWTKKTDGPVSVWCWKWRRNWKKDNFYSSPRIRYRWTTEIWCKTVGRWWFVNWSNRCGRRVECSGEESSRMRRVVVEMKQK